MSTGSNSNNSRDLTDRRSVLTICQTAAIFSCVSLLLGSVHQVQAQPAFAPPPRPQTSAVRGIYDPAQSPPSPAMIAPAPSPQVVAPPISSASSITPSDASPSSITPTTSSGIQPLEGGEIIARVDGQIILASDILWQVNQIIEANRDRIPPGKVDEARRGILRQQVMGLIDTKLLYADFLRTVPSENLPKIEENLLESFEEGEVSRLIKMLDVKDRLALVEMLEANGSSLADVRRQFNERTIAGEWLRQLAPKPKPVTHEQMLEYYQQHLSEYEYPSQAKWEELMLRFDRFGGDRETTWRGMAEIGNELWKRVQANPNARGPVFTEIAKQKSHGFTASEGGKHDWTTRGALRSKAIDGALFSLQVGQLSNIIETETGFHIVRVLERKEAGRTSFEEAQSEIRKQIEAGSKRELVEEGLIKLRKQSRVWTVFDGSISSSEISKLLGSRKNR